jgi:hypothetical protein
MEPTPPATPQSAPSAPPAISWSRKRIIALVVLLGLVVAGATHYWQLRKQWATLAPDGLPASGGRYFFRAVELEVPTFRQGDARWGDDRLGPTASDTLASHGCAVASAAMVLASYGVATDPQRLNDFLTTHQGYTPQGWLKWEVAAMIAPQRVTFAYEDAPSFKLIDDNLSDGNPVIARLRYPSGVTHFVVIAGKEGYDYLICDPGARANRGLYPLKEFGSAIEALRFYRKA